MRAGGNASAAICMNVFILMAAVTACYTVSSLSDKYAASEAKFSGNEFTFLICSSLSVFTTCFLPFYELRFELSWQSFAAVLAVALCKTLELRTAAVILRSISAFELKAWLGINLFVSYFTEVAGGAALSPAKLGCIALTAAGLLLIVHSQKSDRGQYAKIIVPLILYLISKYAYSIVIKGFTPYVSPILQVLFALLLVSVITLFLVSPVGLFRRNRKGTFITVAARLPNAAGMMIENAVIAISITSYSFIQPLILVTLFVIDLIRRRDRRPAETVGGVICIVGVILFELVF